jgi:hypothetical protein
MTAKTYDLDAAPKSLLTVSGNPKISKGEKEGYWTAALHLAPHKASGVMNTCANASAGCAAVCLAYAGRGSIGLDENRLNTIQVARIQRTRYLKRNRAAFLADLTADIHRHIRRAKKAGMIPAFRLNCLSDLPWERWGMTELVAEAGGICYDYTAYPVSKRDRSHGYHLTFSAKEDNQDRMLEALESGVNVATVFNVGRGKDLPETWDFAGETWPVIDGDLTDLRFTDQIQPDGRGMIVGLRSKGTVANRQAGVDSGFVREVLPA